MADRVKRERKSTDHFSPGTELKEPKKVVIEEGKGTKLGEIPNVAFKLDALKSSDEVLEGLHTLLYKSKGKTVTRKREIKCFSGFVFPDGDEAGEREKLVTRLTRWTLAGLHGLMDLLDIPRGSGEESTKEKKVDRIADFLLEPKVLSEKDLAAKKAEKKEKAAKAKERKERASAKKSAKKPAKKATDKKPAASTPKKKSTPAKAAKSPAAEKPTSGKKRKAETDEGETPAKKKAKKPAGEGKAGVAWPSDGAVASDIQAIMQKAAADSSNLTQRDIYTRLGEKYGMSVGEIKKKKELIKDVCSSYKVESQANGQQEDKEETAAAANAEPTKEEADTEGKDEAEAMEEDTAVEDAPDPAEAAVETEAGDAPAETTEEVTIASPAKEAKEAPPAQPEAPQDPEKTEQPAEEAAGAAVNDEAKPNGSEPEPQSAEEPPAPTVEKDAQPDGPSQPQPEDATTGDTVEPPVPASS